MSAKEMFEKLKWKYYGFRDNLRVGLDKIDVRCTTEIKNEKGEIIDITIYFHCDKYIKVTSYNEKKGLECIIFYFSPELIKAINQQVKELGWLDE